MELLVQLDRVGQQVKLEELDWVLLGIQAELVQLETMVQLV
jgi:hypothetical protein